MKSDRFVAVCNYSTERDHRFTNQFCKTADTIWNEAPLIAAGACVGPVAYEIHRVDD